MSDPRATWALLVTAILWTGGSTSDARAAGAAAINATEANPVQDEQPSRRVVLAGAYELMYFGRTVGREQFRIERTADGYEIAATLRMDVGDQPSSESVYTLDSDRRLIRATYHSLEDERLVAAYERDGETLRAVVKRDGAVVDEQSLTIPEDAIITGPHYVTDFFVLAPLAYEVSEKRSMPTYAFGFEDWRVHEVDMDVKRERNRTIDGPDRSDIDAHIYRAWIDTGDSSFKTRSWLDERGVSVRITIERFIGYVDIRLRTAD